MSETHLTLNQVLRKASNEELQELLEFLRKQWNSSVTKRDIKVNDANRNARIRLIEKEIREYGGNTFVGIFRSAGGLVDYDEIVRDVAKKFSVETENQSIPEIEARIFGKIMEKALEKMSEEDRNKFYREMEKIDIEVPSNMNTEGIIVFLLGVLLGGGLASYQLMLILLEPIWWYILGRGLIVSTGVIMGTRLASLLLGPVGAVFALIWLALDLAGPAYRVTIPCVLYIAMLRRKP